MNDDEVVMVLRWSCKLCASDGDSHCLYWQGLTKAELEKPLSRLHPHCGRESLVLAEVTWLPEDVTSEEAWKVVGRVAHPELYETVAGAMAPTIGVKPVTLRV